MRRMSSIPLSCMPALIFQVVFLFCHIQSAYTMNVTLEWSANSESDINGYKLYYTTGPAGSPYDGIGAVEGCSPINVGKVTRYTLTGLSDTQNYRFAVTAYDTQGLESDYSDEVIPIKITGITSTYYGPFTIGKNVPITINFSEPVTLAGGNLIITLNTGHIAEVTPFTSQVSASTNYIIRAGDATDDLNVISLTLSDGATMGNTSGSNCVLSLPLSNNLADGTDIIIDTTPPSAPMHLDLAASDDSGVSDSDNITRKTSGLTITGDGEYNAAVQLYDNGTAVNGATGVISSAEFLIDISLSAGVHIITARQIDAAGNISAPSEGLNITIDTTSPTLALSYNEPGPYRSLDVVEVFATFTEGIPNAPQITIDYAGGNLSTANMITSGDSRIWVYPINIPSGFEGAASILITGTDRAGNMVGSQAGNLFTVDNTAPSIHLYPSINFSSKTIDITYSEDNLMGAMVEAHYDFSPCLRFARPGEFNDIAWLNGSTYRLSMSSIPVHAIFVLTVRGITDAAGNSVSPASVVINDNDVDHMADDWEIDKGVSNPSEDPDNDDLTNIQEFSLGTEPGISDTDSDGLRDGWEVQYRLNPISNSGIYGRDGDPDHDGRTNYDEYLNNTNPYDNQSPPPPPPMVKKSLPPGKKSNKLYKDGQSDSARIPNNTSFSVLLEDADGIDLTDTASIKFTIIDGDNSPYERNLSDTEVIRTVKLNSQENNTQVTSLWVVYDRSQERELGNFSYGRVVTIKVDAKDRRQSWMAQASYTIEIETEQKHNAAQTNLPDIRDLTEDDPALEGEEYNAGIQVSDGDLYGAKIIYNKTEPIVPTFGPPDEISTLFIAGMETAAVGTALNLQPPTVFSKPIKVYIPCPGESDVSELSIFLHTGTEWVLACDPWGMVQPDGEAWMEPDSRVNHNDVTPPAIEIKVYYLSSGVQAGKKIMSEEIPGEEIPGEEIPGEEIPGGEIQGKEIPGSPGNLKPDSNKGATSDYIPNGCFINSLKSWTFFTSRRGMKK